MMTLLFEKCRMNLKTTKTRLKVLESRFKSSYWWWRNCNDLFIIRILILLRSSLILKQRRRNLRPYRRISRKSSIEILDQDQGLEIEISLTSNLLLLIDQKNLNHLFHQVVYSKTFQKRKKRNLKFRKLQRNRKSLRSNPPQLKLNLLHWRKNSKLSFKRKWKTSKPNSHTLTVCLTRKNQSLKR